MKKFNFIHKTSVLLTLFYCVFCFSQTTFAQIKFAQIFSDNVVLQRQKPIPVWGWAKPSEDVIVLLEKQKQTAKADKDGKWMVNFKPMEAGGPFVLEASADSGKVLVKDVLIGEVWLCSGQSNMEWTVKQAKDFENEKKDADYPMIRHFFVEHEVTISPEKDLKKGVWVKSSSETFGDFTAVGFFFARKVYKELGVPVGLVHSSWGGSQIEGWISKEGMMASDEFKDYAINFPKDWAEADARLERQLKQKLVGTADFNPTLADEKRYTNSDFDFTKWHKAGAMGQWDWQGIWAWRGNGFMAKTVEVPAEFVGKETILGLAGGFNYNEVYINGKQVFAGILKGEKREVVVPRNFWKTGENKLVVKMNKMIEPEWFGLGLMGSADDVFVKTDDKKIMIGGNGWHLMPSFAEEHTYAHSSNNLGTTIYNGMIAPLIPFSIQGVLWYQGETNAGRSYQYRKAFPLLINDWRSKWNDDFYFYFVQLSSFGSNQSSNVGSGWAELREAQTMTLSLPKTGMAVTIDIGDANDIHPVNKQDVGLRLAANALKQTYGKDVPFSSPMFDSVKFVEELAFVSFKFTYDGLTARDKFGYVRGFEIAGDDKKFHYAKAEIEGFKIFVWNKNVKNPVAVRYAWSEAPIDANVYNSAGFPLSPFRTDDWNGVTINSKFK